jgi:hypothetical protein
MQESRARLAALAGLAMLAVVASATVARPVDSLALLTDAADVEAELASGAIFPGERVTTAFDLRDSSAGSEVDVSSPFAFAADGRTIATSAWATTFASDRYLEFDLNAPLPAGLAVSPASFTFRFSSTGAAGGACFYFEVRRISTGAVVTTHGSALVPIACATGTTFSSNTTAIPAVDSTDVANDLRIRVFGNDSGANGMSVDRAIVAGDTAYVSFELYPVMFLDGADSTPAELPWELAGQ